MPIPTFPLLSIVNAGVVEVAKVVGEEVAIYKKLPAERSVQALDVPVVSVSASCGAVDEAMFSVNRGVEVPRPRLLETESHWNCVETPAFPNRTVEDAERLFVSKRSVEVEFAVVPKLVVGLHGNPGRQLPPIEKHPAARLNPPVP